MAGDDVEERPEHEHGAMENKFEDDLEASQTSGIDYLHAQSYLYKRALLEGGEH